MMPTLTYHRSLLFYSLIGLIFLSAGFILFENKAVVIENKKGVLTYYLVGGALADFHLKQNPHRPFLSPVANTPYSGIQSLILTSDNNKNSTIDAASQNKRVTWELINTPYPKNGNIEMMMKGDFLSEQLSIKRYVKLDSETPTFSVKEEYYNHAPEKASVDIIQHIGLNSEWVVNSLIESNIGLSLRVEPNQKSLVTKRMKEPGKLIWLTITNSSKQLLLGYIWNSQDFPTLNFQQDNNDYFLEMRGSSSKNLEEVIPNASFLSKQYLCFLLQVPKNFTGVEDVQIKSGRISLTEKEGEEREIDISKAINF